MPRVYTYNLFETKQDKLGDRIEKAVLPHRDPSVCAVVFFAANLFSLCHILGYPFPDLTGEAFYDVALFPKGDDISDPLKLHTHRRHINKAYKYVFCHGRQLRWSG